MSGGGPVNNGVSVDLIRRGEVFRGLIEIAAGNCSEMSLPDFFIFSSSLRGEERRISALCR